MESPSHIIWMPSKFITLWGAFGLQMYDIMTALALIGGSIGWLVLTRKIKIPMWKKLFSLGILGIVTVFSTRLFHILFWEFHQYIDHPWQLLQVGIGRSIHGSIFGFGISAFIISKIWKRPLSQIADTVSFWPIFGLICARIGNFWNSEMIGTPSSWPLAIGFYFSGDRGAVARHPVQLYEATLAILLLLIIVFLLIKKTNVPFRIPAIAIIGFSLIRFLCDFIKEDAGNLLGSPLSTGQLLSIAFLAFGIYLLFAPPAESKKLSY